MYENAPALSEVRARGLIDSDRAVIDSTLNTPDWSRNSDPAELCPNFTLLGARKGVAVAIRAAQ